MLTIFKHIYKSDNYFQTYLWGLLLYEQCNTSQNLILKFYPKPCAMLLVNDTSQDTLFRIKFKISNIILIIIYDVKKWMLPLSKVKLWRLSKIQPQANR